MRSLLSAIILYSGFIGSALAQTGVGQLAPNALVGNPTTSAAPPTAFPLTTPLKTPSADGSNFLIQNGSKTAFSMYSPFSPAGLFVYANVRSVIDVEPTSGVQNYNAYDSWIFNNVAPSTGCGLGANGCGHAVGYEAYCINAVANASCFGLNPALTDSFDGTLGNSVASTMTGMEIDFSPFNAGSHVAGISVVLNNSVAWSTGGATAFQALTTGTTQWSNGFTIGDGALVNGGAGILLGTQGVATGAAISSGSAVFGILDTGGSERHVFLQAQPNGAGNSQFAIYDGALPSVGLAFVLGPTTSSPQIVMKGTGTNSGSVVGSSAAGGGLNLQSTNNGAPSADYVKMTVGAANIFDCNLSFAGYCTIRAVNGLAMNNGNITQINVAAARIYESSGTAPVGNTGTCATGITTAGGNSVGTWTSTAICGIAGTIILSSMAAAPVGYVCDAIDRTTPAVVLQQTAAGTTSATFTVRATATVANDIIQFKCMGY